MLYRVSDVPCYFVVPTDLKRDVLGKDSESEQTTTTTESITADRAAAQNQAAPDAVKPVGSTLSNVLFIGTTCGSDDVPRLFCFFSGEGKRSRTFIMAWVFHFNNCLIATRNKTNIF